MTVDTRLENTFDIYGNVTGYAQLSVFRSGARVIVKSSSNLLASVMWPDKVTQDGVVVHAINKVLMPPNTYPTLAKALRAKKEMGTSRAYLSQNLKLRADMAKAGYWASVIVPDNTAWKDMAFRPPVPSWAGNITSKAIVYSKDLRGSLVKYFFVQMPNVDVPGVLTYDKLMQAWATTEGTLKTRNLMSLPTTLTSLDEQRYMMYTFDETADALFLIGERNMIAQPYMTGGQFYKRTLWGGCSTVMTTSGWVHLPYKTGVKPYDQQPTNPDWF